MCMRLSAIASRKSTFKYFGLGNLNNHMHVRARALVKCGTRVISVTGPKSPTTPGEPFSVPWRGHICMRMSVPICAHLRVHTCMHVCAVRCGGGVMYFMSTDRPRPPEIRGGGGRLAGRHAHMCRLNAHDPLLRTCVYN